MVTGESDHCVWHTNRKRFEEQDRFDDIEEVEGAMEGGGAVHVL
jgi:hypothetical protein